MQTMSLSNHWNSMSRLNRTRSLVVVFLVTVVIVLATIPLVLFADVI